MANTIETNKVTQIEPCTPNMSVERCFLEIKPPNVKRIKTLFTLCWDSTMNNNYKI